MSEHLPKHLLQSEGRIRRVPVDANRREDVRMNVGDVFRYVSGCTGRDAYFAQSPRQFEACDQVRQ